MRSNEKWTTIPNGALINALFFAPFSLYIVFMFEGTSFTKFSHTMNPDNSHLNDKNTKNSCFFQSCPLSYTCKLLWVEHLGG
jgi:hypothetical protein